MLPRRNDIINVVPYGPAKVLRMLSEARAEVLLDNGFVKASNGTWTNKVVVEVHTIWTVSPGGAI